jgi:hypothetical protein
MPGMIIRKENGDLKWFPLFNHGNKYSFYPPPGQETGTLVGKGWFPDKILPGYWTPGQTTGHRRRIGGGSSFIILKEGLLKHFPFQNHTFFVPEAGKVVGKGFRPTLDYYVAEWMNNGTSDLLVRDEEGNLRLFPFNGQSFVDLGEQEKVGHGFTKEVASELYPGYWTGGSTPDLLVRMNTGDLVVYPFNGQTFRKNSKWRPGLARSILHSLLMNG